MNPFVFATAVLCATVAVAGQTPKVSTPAPKTPASTASSAQVDRIVKQATAARQAEHWEDAVDLYTRIVKLRPDYVEGYWYQGTALYQLDRFQECRDSFRKVIRF